MPSDQGENLVNITGKLNITADGATAKNLNVNKPKNAIYGNHLYLKSCLFKLYIQAE